MASCQTLVPPAQGFWLGKFAPPATISLPWMNPAKGLASPTGLGCEGAWVHFKEGLLGGSAWELSSAKSVAKNEMQQSDRRSDGIFMRRILAIATDHPNLETDKDRNAVGLDWLDVWMELTVCSLHA